MESHLIFFCKNFHQLSTAVKADENQNQLRELKFGIHINFSIYMKFQINFISYQLSIADDS